MRAHCGRVAAPSEASVAQAGRAGVSSCTQPGIGGTTTNRDAYLARVRPQLAVTPAARNASLFVLVPPMPGWVQLLTPARPAWSTLAAISAATLPRWARRLYGLPGYGLTDTAATAAVRAFRRTALAVPAQVRESPIVRAARERVASAEPLTA